MAKMVPPGGQRGIPFAAGGAGWMSFKEVGTDAVS